MSLDFLADCKTEKKVRGRVRYLEPWGTLSPVYATSVGGRYVSGWLILAFQSMPSIAASPIRIAVSGSASIRSSRAQVARLGEFGPHFRWSWERRLA